ncbi:O-antigen ligase family protein [Clostridiaceae bacterium HFYG-1003]|nr:O-antigen ligase family protein [Clostridiaceae bacterium HFYG-1003]
MSSTNKQHKIGSATLYILLSFFFIYAFWYQNAYSEIRLAFPVLGVLILILSCMNLHKSFNYYNPLWLIIFFIIISSMNSLLFGKFPSLTTKYVFNIIEYLIPMFGIYVYVDGKIDKLRKILWILSVAITLVALWSLIDGKITSTGAIALGDLNVNVESSYFAVAVVSNVVLFGSGKATLWKKSIIITSTLLCAKAQIDSASRRGFLILAFLLMAGIISYIHIKYKKKPLVRGLFFISMVLTVTVAIYLLADVFLTTTLFQRFLSGGEEGGDTGRKILMGLAFDYFLDSPIVGAGFGAIEGRIGVYSHSMYFELLGCTGIIGFGIFITMLLRCAKCFYCNASALSYLPEDLIITSRGFLLLVISVLISGYAVVYIYDMYFYIILGLVFSMQRILKEERERNYSKGNISMMTSKSR